MQHGLVDVDASSYLQHGDLCDLDIKVKGQIMYFLVNAAPKPLAIAILNFVSE